MKKINRAIFPLLLLAVGSVWAQPAPIDDAFEVNAYTTGDQRDAVAAMDAGGNFVIVWRSDGSDGTDMSGTSVLARRYFSTGSPAGPAFQVNTETTGDQGAPAIAMNAAGDFVIAWAGRGDLYIGGRRFASTGAATGSQFTVNDITVGDHSAPAVAIRDTGEFVVSWASLRSTGNDPADSIQARRFGSDGSALGAGFQVNTYTPDIQRYPDLAFFPDGGFVVTWASLGSDGTDSDDMSIQARRFEASGAPIGNDLQVNESTAGTQVFPSIDAREGEFVVSWQSYVAAVASSVRGRRFASGGAAVAAEFQVASSAPEGPQPTPPDVAFLGGGFLVAWPTGVSDADILLRS
ncbi:MAG: hypothetical protein AAGM22_32410, partial [Acidobacteriota bacterium]